MELDYGSFQKFLSFFPYFFYPILGITIPLFLLDLYIVLLKTPKEMKQMKWFILNIDITNFLLVLEYALWQSVPLFPFSGIFSLGILGNFGAEGSYVGMYISTVIVPNLLLSHICLLCYHYSIMKGRGWFSEFIQSPMKFIITYLISIVTICGVLITILRLAKGRSDGVFTEIPQNMTNLYNFFQDIWKDQPSATSYTDHTSQFSQIFVYTFACLMLIEFFLIIFFNILILLSIKSTSKLVTSTTFQLQLSFYKTTLIDSIFVILFIWMPVFIGPIIVIFKISDFRVGVLGFNSSIIGAPISYLLNMVLIKPYRKFFISILGKIFRKEISETSATKVQTVHSKIVNRSK